MRLTAFLALIAVAAAAFAQSDLPRRKSGLWLLTISGTELPPDIPEIRFHECVDDQKTGTVLADLRECKKPQVRRQGAGYVLETVCKKNGSTGTTRMLFSGDFQRAYKADIKVSYSPPLKGRSEDTGKIEGKWVSASCPPGREPGWTMMVDEDEDEDDKPKPAQKKKR
jgi:hypothetical protein